MSEKPARLPLHLNTRTITSHLFYGPYIFLPLICTFVWLGGILALLGLWVRDGKPRYRDDLPSVVFISHVGAVYHTLFIVIASITGAFFILSMFAERWLRHVDRLPADLRKREKVFDWLAIVFAIIASAGLILCSILDAFNHGSIHWAMALVFIVFTALSAIFQSAEIWSLHKDHPDRRSLLRNSIIKLVVITIAVAGAIGFGVTYGLCGGDPFAHGSRSAAECNRISSACAALEWTIAFVLVFYFATLIADLWPAGKSSPRYMRRLARWQEKHEPQLAPQFAQRQGGQFGGDDFTGRGAFETHPDRWMNAEQRAEVMQREMKARNQGREGELELERERERENMGNRYGGGLGTQAGVGAGAAGGAGAGVGSRPQGYAEEELQPPSSSQSFEATPRASEGSFAPMVRNAV